jgi:lipopolysaccharide/colanic/teichoic acid biosynthesis glycosyltransferase
MYKYIFKPFIDYLFAFIALLVFSPIIILLFIGLYLANNGKPMFFQERVGKNGTIFKVIKFKTMNDAKDSVGELLPDKDRLTRIGKFVRSTSLDELPQLMNVLIGNMSLIGPRPLLIEYLPLYSPTQLRRHELKPGITGWAQVNGRNAISWQKKFELDVWYVDNISLWLDIKIIYLTILKVVQRKDISSDTSATIEKFTGNK